MPEQNKHKSTLDFDVRIKKVDLGDIITDVTKQVEGKMALGATRAVAGEAFDISDITSRLILISEDVQRTKDKLEIALKSKDPAIPILKGAQHLLDYTIPRTELINKLRGILEQKLPTQEGDFLNFLKRESGWAHAIETRPEGREVTKAVMEAVDTLTKYTATDKPKRGQSDEIRKVTESVLDSVSLAMRDSGFKRDAEKTLIPIQLIFEQIQALFTGGKGELKVKHSDMKNIMKNVFEVLEFRLGATAPVEAFEDIANYITRAVTTTKHAHLLSAEMFDKLAPEIIKQATTFVSSPNFLNKFGDAVISAEEEILSSVIRDRIDEITMDTAGQLAEVILTDIPMDAAQITKRKITPLLKMLKEMEARGGLDEGKVNSISNLISIVFSRLGQVKSSTVIKNMNEITKAFSGFEKQDVISTATLIKNMEEMFKFISEQRLTNELKDFGEGVEATKEQFGHLTAGFLSLTEQMNRLGTGVEKVRELHKQIVLKGNQKNIESFIKKLESIEIKQASDILTEVLAKTTDKEARKLSWKIIKEMKDELSTIQEVTDQLETIITSREEEKGTMDEFRGMLGNNFEAYKKILFEFARRINMMDEVEVDILNAILESTSSWRNL